MRLLICGGRDFAYRELFVRTMVPYRKTATLVIHGGATGADAIADEWARHWRIPVEVYPADWGKHGRAAGPVRNQRMLDDGRPDLVIAFPGGRGTADMVRRAAEAQIQVVQPDTAAGKLAG